MSVSAFASESAPTSTTTATTTATAVTEKTGLDIVGTRTAQFAMECVPKASKKHLTSEHRILRVQKSFDRTKSGDTLYTELHKIDVDKTEVDRDDPCGILQRKLYSRGKLLETKNLNPHFSYVEFEKVGYECGSGYEPFFPRLDLWLEDAPKWGGFLLDGDFSVLAAPRRKQAGKDFAAARKGAPPGSVFVDFFVRTKNPEAVHVVLDHSESGTEYAIYRLEKKKLVEVQRVYDPPCGS